MTKANECENGGEWRGSDRISCRPCHSCFRCSNIYPTTPFLHRPPLADSCSVLHLPQLALIGHEYALTYRRSFGWVIRLVRMHLPRFSLSHLFSICLFVCLFGKMQGGEHKPSHTKSASGCGTTLSEHFLKLLPSLDRQSWGSFPLFPLFDPSSRPRSSFPSFSLIWRVNRPIRKQKKNTGVFLRDEH